MLERKRSRSSVERTNCSSNGRKASPKQSRSRLIVGAHTFPPLADQIVAGRVRLCRRSQIHQMLSWGRQGRVYFPLFRRRHHLTPKVSQATRISNRDRMAPSSTTNTTTVRTKLQSQDDRRRRTWHEVEAAEVSIRAACPPNNARLRTRLDRYAVPTLRTRILLSSVSGGIKHLEDRRYLAGLFTLPTLASHNRFEARLAADNSRESRARSGAAAATHLR